VGVTGRGLYGIRLLLSGIEERRSSKQNIGVSLSQGGNMAMVVRARGE